MSRHMLPSPDGAEPGTETLVGWDTQMLTYYLTIEPSDDSLAEPVYLGREHEECSSLVYFLLALTRHKLHVPDGLVAELYFDRELGRANTETDWRGGDPIQIA
ncbi:hypothetical protein KGQ20_04085 [Catenulispora sp. NF23]|uniref:Uncharacterized protein n=1 Tax=Catenulispora pinistramenti TaxID=2705254 RepID=A0ABS5KJK6_9ACTN|nr:hypothetical protein [Catenulispora pinistramenti]MBS2531943.1 hypothetical protein [Catenulispora pinistramenti]MBS2546210.1 hypothetical protein [Catenulispora pinistramenti]